MTEFRLLGHVEAVQDGRPLPVRGPKQRGLLAMLLLARGEVVSRDRLIEGLWGEAPPPRVGHALDAQVSSLRRVLGAERVIRRTPGYAFRLEPGELDLDRFEQLRAAGRPQEALAQWRGPPLADVLSEPFAAAAARELDEMRVATLEDRIDADLARGDGAELVAELERLVAEHPFRERLIGALATALYRATRQAAALEVLAAARRRFAEELGLEPAPQLRMLEQRILEHDSGLRPSRRRKRRRPHRSVVVACALVGAGAVAVLALEGGDPPAAPRFAGAQVIAFDAASGRVLHAATLPAGADAIAADRTGVWVANPDTNAVVRVDPRTGERTARVPVAARPEAIATGDGAIWVAGEQSVRRIDPDTTEVTQTIRLRGHPSALAFGAHRLWVADEGGRTLTRVRPGDGRPERTATLDDRPTAVAVATGAVWVASHAADTVTALDPATMSPVASVGVGGGPDALVAGAGAVWAANGLDGTVSRIDVARPRVVATVPVGSSPTALAFAGGSLWVAHARGVSRIDPRTNTVTGTQRVAARPESLAAAGHTLVVGTVASREQAGGTLRLLASSPPPTLDPAYQAALLPLQFLGLAHDGLVTYNHASGAEGLRLVPDLADALPPTGRDTTTYRFRLRPGIRYSTGVPVRASDFRRAIERIFEGRSPAVDYLQGIAGTGGCPRSCDFARGVLDDDAARTVTFRLRAPDPDFLYKLAALNYASPVPAGTPTGDVGNHPIPGTGPYRIARADEREVRFVRNPYFHEWSAAAQPAGLPDEIVWRFGLGRGAEVRAVEGGRADLTWEGVPPSMAAEVGNRHAAQLHVYDTPQTDFLQLNARGVPFRDVRVRRAFNLAIDRERVAQLYASGVRTTCQLLPRGLRAHRDYCPYGYAPERARRLVAAAGAVGARVDIWAFDNTPLAAGLEQYAAHVLERLGLRARTRHGTHAEYEQLKPADRDGIDVVLTAWFADYPSPTTFFDTFLACDSATAGGFTCDPRLDRLLRRARALAATDAAAADAVWARADRRAVDRAWLAPLVNARETDFVSERVRGYRFHPLWGFVADQASLAR